MNMPAVHFPEKTPNMAGERRTGGGGAGSRQDGLDRAGMLRPLGGGDISFGDCAVFLPSTSRDREHLQTAEEVIY